MKVSSISWYICDSKLLSDGFSYDPYCQNGENLKDYMECKSNEKCFKTKIKEGSNVLVSWGCSIEYSKLLCPYATYIPRVVSEVQPTNANGECHYCDTELYVIRDILLDFQWLLYTLVLLLLLVFYWHWCNKKRIRIKFIMWKIYKF